jgi:Ni,Fe-hydrogenase III small subunit
VSPGAFDIRGEPGVFHLRMGGCGGCAEMVDSALRDGYGPRLLAECSSPRHSGTLVVTGCWTGNLAVSVERVIAQAPPGARLVVVGDCAMGYGFVFDRGRLSGSIRDEHDVYAEIEGCPVERADFLEVMGNVPG